MLMLRYMFKKIHVSTNSLIKYRFVRKIHKDASFTQSIAQTKARLRLDEAGGILHGFSWFMIFLFIVIFFVIFLLLLFFWPNFAFWVAVGWAAVGGVAVEGVAVYARYKYMRRWDRNNFHSIDFNILINGDHGRIDFYSSHAGQDYSSVVAEAINNYFASHPTISLDRNYSNREIVSRISRMVFANSSVGIPRCFERNEEVRIRFRGGTYRCDVVWY